jgi:lysophospholipase L1-like esterase
MNSTQAFSSSDVKNTVRRLAVAIAMAGAAAFAAAGPAPAPGNKAFLALGDSVVFGYITQDGYAYVNPANFVGYPEYLGRDLRLDTANASCPGETTSGFISSAGADNGCRPFRANFPLHVGYTSTQLNYATSFLAANKQTRLVTISLGANDAFLLQKACNGDIACIQAGLPGLLNTIYANMNTILGNLRATGFKGALMVVNYYSVDYTDPVQTGFTMAINQTLAAVAAANSVPVADAFSAFQAAATPAGGKACMAGLLNASPQNQYACDVHPSQSGQQLLAKTVNSTFAQAGR